MSHRKEWGANEKNACGDCIYAEKNEECLITGLYDKFASVTFVLDYPTDGEVNFETYSREIIKRAGGGREIETLLKINRQAIIEVKKRSQKPGGQPVPDINPDHYNLCYLTGYPGKGVPRSSAVSSCAKYVTAKIRRMRYDFDINHPDSKQKHVLVPLGSAATSILLQERGGFKKKRGIPVEVHFAGYDFWVVPTLSLREIMGAGGKAPIMVKDLCTAYELSYGGIVPDPLTGDDILRMYRFPQNNEELVTLTDAIIEYTGNPEKRTPAQWPISVDTETNSLNMYESDAKMVMMSVGWDVGKATAIAIGYDEMPYDKDVALECIRRLMACPKPKIFHNFKFDFQVLELNEDIPVRNVSFDTMLGAHFLYEEMRGYFSLDDLTKFMLPKYVGYKAMIDEGLKLKVRQELVESVGHAKPDVTKGFEIMPFFPDVDYAPAVSDTLAEYMLSPEERVRLWYAELDYVRAFHNEDKKAKNRARNQVRKICKKNQFPVPDTASKRDYGAEIADHGYERVPFSIMQAYAAADADVTWQIYKEIRRRAWNDVITTRELEPKGAHEDMFALMRELLIPASRSLGVAQFHGTQIDQDLLRTYERDLEEFVRVHEVAIRNLLCDPDFNPNSTVQVERVFREIFPIPDEDVVTTETDAMSVRKDWLKDMEEKYEGKREFRDAHTFIKHLRRYREGTKALNTFVRGIRNLLDAKGRIHTQFSQNGTATGRLSSSRMNLQNIPFIMCRFEETPGWNLKQLFVPDEGYAWWQLDISAAEIRVLCAYARDEELIAALQQGFDIHSFTTAEVFGHTYEYVMANKDTNPLIKLQRTAIKRVIFGTLYGAGDYKIAEQIFGTLSTDPDKEKEQVEYARTTREGIFSRFPRTGQYVDGTKAEVQHNLAVKTFFGRRRRFQVASANRRMLSAAKRQAVNFKIQSTASDIVVSQLNEVFENLPSIEATLQLTVHDSICGSVPYNRLADLPAFFDEFIVNRVKEKFPWLPVPFAYDLDFGLNYGQTIAADRFFLPTDELTQKEQKIKKRMELMYG